MPDQLFANSRLAAIYDDLDPDRSDVDHYLTIAEEFGAHSLLDVGCGTGVLACLLASRGLDVVGVDPAEAMLQVARHRLGGAAGQVRWLLGDATDLSSLELDMATMTGNVAQVFLSDEDWMATLSGIGGALRPAGHLVFEVREPARRAWEEWNREESFSRVEIPGVGVVESWIELTDVSLPLVSFRGTCCFEDDGVVLTSDSILRFRERDEVQASLEDSGYVVLDIRDAPDRPGPGLC